MTDERQIRRGGFYWIDNKPYVTVTTVLKVIDKPALRFWFGREVYRAMVVDPSLSEKEALGMPYKTTMKAAERGTTIHSIVETWKHGKKQIATVPEKYRGFAQAFYDFVEDNHVEIIENEKTVVSKKHGYAGTLDIVCSLNGSKQTLLIDVKTGKDIYPDFFLQLSAYQHAYKENTGVDAGIAVLLLKETGKYKFEKGDTLFREFLASKLLWEWQNRELCERVGYKGVSKS